MSIRLEDCFIREIFSAKQIILVCSTVTNPFFSKVNSQCESHIRRSFEIKLISSTLASTFLSFRRVLKLSFFLNCNAIENDFNN